MSLLQTVQREERVSEEYPQASGLGLRMIQNAQKEFDHTTTSTCKGWENTV